MDMQAQELIGLSPWLLNVNIPNMPLLHSKPSSCAAWAAVMRPSRSSARRARAARRCIGSAVPARPWTTRKARTSTPRPTAMSITPLKVDLTDHDNLGYWAQTASQAGTDGRPTQGGAVQS